MLSQLSAFTHVIGEKVFQFLVHPNSSFPELKEALAQILKHVGNVEDQIKAQVEAQVKADAESEAEQPKEEPASPTNDVNKQE